MNILEIPELETICGGLSAAVSGCHVRSFVLNNESVTNVKNLPLHIIKKRIYYLFRSGKYIIISLIKKHSCFLVVHLGDAGQIIIVPKDNTEENVLCTFEFRDVDLLIKDPKEETQILYFSDNTALRIFLDKEGSRGRDPLKIRDFTEFYRIAKRTSASKNTIEEWLRDDNIVQGIGPYLTSEILFQSNIHPLSSVSGFTEDDWNSIYDAMVYIIELSMKHKGASISNYVGPFGTRGEYQNHFKIYNNKNANVTNSLLTFFTDEQRLIQQ